ncbi:MAG: Rpn family recombination-promoting nuclease/putative transposase [Bacteroidales bacterium]|nr:Rpn family recombination-promoting nuclease/putative transposase [Bacteroidales bacterium]
MMENFKRGRFADPTNDFAFKRIFGTEQYKDATIGLLNCLFTEINIVDVSFPNTEILGDTEDSRKGFIDVLCTDVKGNQFVIEMQNARQEFFRERTIYYSSKLITGQASVGKWDYRIKPTYVVAFLNFKMERLSDEFKDDGRYLIRYCMRDEETGEKMPGSTEYVFLGIQDFKKGAGELESYSEKWLYLMRNTLTLEEIPDGFGKDKEFKAYFEACERAGFTKEEDEKYTQIMMNEWDIQNAKDLAVREGREEGRKEGLREGLREGIAAGKAEDAKNFLAAGVDIKIISQCTGLDEATIRSL